MNEREWSILAALVAVFLFAYCVNLPTRGSNRPCWKLFAEPTSHGVVGLANGGVL